MTSKPRNARKDDPISNKKPPPKPNPQPIDMSSLISVHVAKYDLTFYGNTIEEVERKIAEFDKKRNGQRHITRKVSRNVVYDH